MTDLHVQPSSILIFRHLAITYLGREDLAQISASEVEVDEESCGRECSRGDSFRRRSTGLIHSAPPSSLSMSDAGGGMTFSGELCSSVRILLSMICQGRCSRCAN